MGEGVKGGGLHDNAAALFLRRIHVLVPVHWTPNGGDQVISCCSAVLDQTSTGLADSYPWSRKVLTQPLIVLQQPPQLQLRHALLLWSVHPVGWIRLLYRLGDGQARRMPLLGVVQRTWDSLVRERGVVLVRVKREERRRGDGRLRS